ncbi:membrane protein, putative [Citrifermentans bemidjiense Bem]|uniref:Membrane protein, putative n=1 Tax=Citrifermentans bemidjiense (strain ATCC BAA-1014 / DSM 16622 / JCM 12645 / Bem) TaxID=404380 RepID=B5ECW5_CITBB|nr:hypothetical protein [Citrifermentans bemidjiense]ACH40582.1 membrane protein, putative [Citrifermentans bemidjiense Bem]
MTLSPGIVALLVSSLLVSMMLLIAAKEGASIIRHWNMTSGSELQLALERRTYLISTIVAIFLPLQLFSLFLFINTVDGISHLFTGAMCAAGTLKVNRFGYPTLFLKMVTFLLAGIWLILNHADNEGRDYPLIRVKYWLLLLIVPVLLIETILQASFFWRLRPDVITSCCGALFSKGSGTLASDIVAAPVVPVAVAFFGIIAAAIASGGLFLKTKRGAASFGCISGIAFITAIIAVISFISVYIYELPSHHCPFCLLHREYHFIGYLLYALLFSGVVAGAGVGVLHRFKKVASIKGPLLQMQQKLTVVALASFATTALIVIWKMASSTLRLFT